MLIEEGGKRRSVATAKHPFPEGIAPADPIIRDDYTYNRVAKINMRQLKQEASRLRQEIDQERREARRRLR